MEFIGDIVERNAPEQVPEPPKPPSQPLAPRKSRWRERKEAAAAARGSSSSGASRATTSEPTSKLGTTLETATGSGLSEMEKVHLENIERMAKMSPEEIAREREELMNSLDPSVLQALLHRAEKAEQRAVANKTGGNAGTSQKTQGQSLGRPRTQPAPRKETESMPFFNARAPVIHPEGDPEFDNADDAIAHLDANFDSLPDAEPEDFQPAKAPASGAEAPLPEKTVHFTRPSDVADDDDEPTHDDPLEDPLFYEKMHDKYFPTLPVESDKLAWMLPMGEDELEEYSASAASLAPGELRFDFRGDLVTPRRSRDIDPAAGLHHHGDAPAAAGYTVPELAHLARSTVAAQRTIAIQTLGRVLFKVNKRHYGQEISEALGPVIATARVLDTLTEAADEGRTRSVNVRAHATDALWLYNSSKPPARAV